MNAAPIAHRLSRIANRYLSFVIGHRSSFSRLLPFLALALAVLPAAWPYFGAEVPRTNDLFPHLYRALALDRLVREGHLWPRWSPDLVHGYGYPVFNFFPALSHYLVVLYHLVGLPLTTAYRAAVLTHVILAAWFAYLLARDLFGPAGGWVGALAYVYSPYLLYDAIVRGGLPESQALVFLPLLLFALRRATLRGGRWVAPSALAFAAAMLSHFPITFQFLIPIGLLLLWMGWREGWRHLWKPLVGLALGVLLSAFFWLPTLAEVQYVRADVSISQGYSYAGNLMMLRELLAWPRLPADPALVNPPVVRSLPQVALVLAALVLAWRWRRLSRATRWQVGLWAIILLVCTLLITPLSRPAWDKLPLLNLTLYPWRFLGPASLAGALLAAAAFALCPGSLPGGKRARTPLSLPGRGSGSEGWALALATLLLLAGGIPWLYPPREPAPAAPTMADLVVFEQPPLFIGTTTLGEFLPRWVEALPDTADLANRLAAGESPDRLVVPEGVTASAWNGSPLDATYRVQADSPVTLTYRQFYFPGWRATLDSAPIPLHPSHPEGLILLDVPAGGHTLRVRFGSTLPRILGWALSGLAALILAVLLVWPANAREEGFTAKARRTLRNFTESLRSWRLSGAKPEIGLIGPYWFLALAGLVLAAKVFFDHVDTPLRRPMLGPDGLHSVQHTQTVDFAGELGLLGTDQSVESIPADADVKLTLYWRPLRPIGVVYDVVVQMVDENGLAWNMGDATRPRDWRFAPGTDFWPLDGYVMDPYILRLVDGTPPGEYTFRIALVRRDTGQTAAERRIGRLVVTQPARGDRPLEEGMTPAVETDAWGGLRLLGSRTDRAEAAPGDPARVTLLWQVTGPVAGDSPLTLRLVTGDGEPVLTTTAALAPHYPPSLWQPGDRLRSEILLRLPARTPDGAHTWQVQPAPSAPLWLVGSLRLHAPARLWAVPTLDAHSDVLLGNTATLLGANLYSPSSILHPPISITVTLAWRAETETATSYRVFLHLVGSDGNIVAQSDSEPANWTRPTTGWLPGEIVLDERVLDIPAGTLPGRYTLLAGLYDLATGARLTNPAGSDAIPLAIITIQSP